MASSDLDQRLFAQSTPMASATTPITTVSRFASTAGCHHTQPPRTTNAPTSFVPSRSHPGPAHRLASGTAADRGDADYRRFVTFSRRGIHIFDRLRISYSVEDSIDSHMVSLASRICMSEFGVAICRARSSKRRPHLAVERDLSIRPPASDRRQGPQTSATGPLVVRWVQSSTRRTCKTPPIATGSPSRPTFSCCSTCSPPRNSAKCSNTSATRYRPSSSPLPVDYYIARTSHGSASRTPGGHRRHGAALLQRHRDPARHTTAAPGLPAELDSTELTASYRPDQYCLPPHHKQGHRRKSQAAFPPRGFRLSRPYPSEPIVPNTRIFRETILLNDPHEFPLLPAKSVGFCGAASATVAAHLDLSSG